MAKGPVVDDGTKRLIAGIHLMRRDWTAKEVRNELANRVTPAPGLSFVQKQLASIRRKERELEESKQTEGMLALDDKEGLWHIGLMPEFPISAEAALQIARVQEWALEKGIQSDTREDSFGITMRQALWIARLYDVVAHYMGDDARYLWVVSGTYAIYEMICELTGTPFDTLEFDGQLRKGEKAFSDVFKKWVLSGAADQLDPSIKKLFEALGKIGGRSQ